MSGKATIFLAIFVLSDVQALMEPPIYYDRNNELPQTSACWEEGGICTSVANCPTRHILNLPALGMLCGESGDSVCCSHSPPIMEDEVIQVAACNEKQAFCTWDTLCPPESRVDDASLCGEQEGVSCCTTGLAKKRSLGLPGFFTVPSDVRPSSRRGFLKLRASGTINSLPDALTAGGAGRTGSKFTVDAVSIAKKNARAQDGDSDVIETTSALPASFGAMEKSRGHEITEVNCFMKGGSCVQRELCPEEDQMGPHDLCGYQNFYACCKPSSLTRPAPDADTPQIE